MTLQSTRRSFLRATTSLLALPVLESWAGDRPVPASAKLAAPPTRFVTLYFPNGVYPSAWDAQKSTSGLRLGGCLSPLAKFAHQAVVVQGIDHHLGAHIGQISGFLSGVDIKKSHDGQFSGGESLDQKLAKAWGNHTYLPSLHVAVEPPNQGGFGGAPKSYGNSISWSSATSKIEPHINPQMAFDRVFLGQTDAGRKNAARQKWLVDQVWQEAKSLSQQVSRADQRKLEQYFSSMNDLQNKLDKSMHPVEKSWTPPSASLSRPAEAGIPTDPRTHLPLLLDVLALALQTDSTRVATAVMGHSISRMVYDFVDSSIKTNHHDYSHHRNDPDKISRYIRINTWFSENAAYLLKKMSAIDEGTGSLLDHSVVLYGSGMKDGNTHEPLNIPIALFGGASGRLKTDRLLQANEGTPIASLHLSLLEILGLPTKSYNDLTEKMIPGLT